jgi:hypothetical protein
LSPESLPENIPNSPNPTSGTGLRGWRTLLKSEDFGLGKGYWHIKCQEGNTDCCCRRLLFTQPDFVAQLEELIESRGHICDFYPKFHPELNFIEQYWGLAKYHYRISPKTSNLEEMERNMIEALNTPKLLQIRQ